MTEELGHMEPNEHTTANDLPRVRGTGMSLDEARRAFELYGAALAKLEPTNMREAAKVRMRMDAEVLGWGRFLSLQYWRWWWRAYVA